MVGMIPSFSVLTRWLKTEFGNAFSDQYAYVSGQALKYEKSNFYFFSTLDSLLNKIKENTSLSMCETL